jgi:acyl-CoA synthetase (AMP-forming)/AMP-acid ligase II
MVDGSLASKIFEAAVRKDTGYVLAEAQSCRSVSARSFLRSALTVARKLTEMRGSTAMPAPVAVLGNPSIEMVTALVGALWSGRPVRVLDPGLPQAALGETIATARVGAVLHDSALLRDGILGVEQLSWNANDWANGTWTSGLLAPSTDQVCEPASVQESDIALVLTTSGTTGVPKPVNISHGNLRASFDQYQLVRELGTSDVMLCSLPLFHVAGLNLAVLQPLAAGAPVVLMPKFDEDLFLDQIQQRRITTTNLVPVMASRLVRHQIEHPRDLASLRFVSVGAAPVSAGLQDSFLTTCGVPLLAGYGMTETCSLTHHARGVQAGVPEGYVGTPLEGTDFRIEVIDPNNDPLVGEVWVRGPQVARTCEDDSTGQEWVGTGDLGYQCADGGLVISGRIKDLIKHNGFPISPSELEATLSRHPDVRDVAVIGLPDPSSGEVPVACIVRGREDLTAEELTQFLGMWVAPQKRVRRIAFLSVIPRTQSGKILRRDLTAMVQEKLPTEGLK